MVVLRSVSASSASTRSVTLPIPMKMLLANTIDRSWSRTNTPGSLRSTFLPPLVDHPTVHVRLSGQDCERGTFNQRHALIVDQKTNKHVWPLRTLSPNTEHEEVHICNSNLSEAATLAFEYGYSLENENALVVWEAQFGDFANVAQAVIDNFILSGEDKWNVQSSLVMLYLMGTKGPVPNIAPLAQKDFCN